ncbi:HD family phosphohydrolase [Spirosoma migulaei]|uniref:HD family phosphohydrolase n=1 Tax=Spirosoma foliorum TaxID=2710596 RepID=A0A7G5H6E6_9BACT|nr:HD family phosphohydrolase [Spirosoma foliorum]QMW06688.1 HD family phosphohydrolase [Spirosoma foliorum]
MRKDELIIHIKEEVEQIYKSSDVSLPYHGWKHIIFVYTKARDFAIELNADLFFVSIAALTHDMNYLINVKSKPSEGQQMRRALFKKYKIKSTDISRIEEIIFEADTSYRHENISSDAKALSDADTLFKSLPITPILFAKQYCIEQDITIHDTAIKIIKYQIPLMEKGIYFYSDSAKKYINWAQANLSLWQNILDYYGSEGEVFSL